MLQDEINCELLHFVQTHKPLSLIVETALQVTNETGNNGQLISLLLQLHQTINHAAKKQSTNR